MKNYFSILALNALLLSGYSSALAQDFKKGLIASEVGDYAAALEEWEPLAAQGNASAQNKLGFMYKAGKGVAVDYVEAVRWYHSAAIQGNASSQANLGFMYKTGKGVPEDFLQSYMWYELAHINGHKDAKKWLHNLSRKMVMPDIESAKAKATKCLSRNYKNCGW